MTAVSKAERRLRRVAAWKTLGVVAFFPFWLVYALLVHVVAPPRRRW